MPVAGAVLALAGPGAVQASTTTVPAGHAHGVSHLGPLIVGGVLVAVMLVGGVRTARQHRRWGTPQE